MAAGTHRRANALSSHGAPEIDAGPVGARAAIEKRNALVHPAWIMRHEEFGAVGHRSRNGGPVFDFHTRADMEVVMRELRTVYETGAVPCGLGAPLTDWAPAHHNSGESASGKTQVMSEPPGIWSSSACHPRAPSRIPDARS